MGSKILKTPKEQLANVENDFEGLVLMLAPNLSSCFHIFVRDETVL